MDFLIIARQPDLEIVYKERICRIVYFAVPTELWVKLKENEKRDKNLEIARKLKNYGK